jgi:hypothetical protein
MSTRRLPEISLQLQEARRRDPDAYRTIAAAARIPVARVKAIAYGQAEPTDQERRVLAIEARG